MPERQPLSLRLVPFSVEAFVAEVRSACGAQALGEQERVPDQVRYLTSYLRHHDRPAKTLVIERPYVDRHYLEEFAGYYATALHPPTSKTTRVHVLAAALTEPEFRNLLRKAAEGGFEESCRELQSMYLGYVVVRPIPSAPVGRTLLRPYSAAAGARCFEPATTVNNVHLAGLRVSVQGVPFQQQDQAVGACATTALWSAISRVARADGSRAPTPLASGHAGRDTALAERPTTTSELRSRPKPDPRRHQGVRFLSVGS